MFLETLAWRKEAGVDRGALLGLGGGGALCAEAGAG